jgi:predicted oxidoreductase
MDTDWLKQMNEDRKKLVNKLNRIEDQTSFEYEELCTSIRAHDHQVTKLMGIDMDEVVKTL